MTVKYFCSTTHNGTMKTTDDNAVTAHNNRVLFIKNCGLLPKNSTLHTLSYGGNDFCRYINLNDSMKGDGIIKNSTVDADAVVVDKPGHAVLLPLADCIGAVIYDTSKKIMMMSHLGRHNLEQNGGNRCINYLVHEFGCNPQDIKVYFSPNAGKKSYPLFRFNNRGMNEVAIEQLMSTGVLRKNITPSPIDSAAHPDYYSHSNYLKAKQKIDGRFVILAYIS